MSTARTRFICGIVYGAGFIYTSIRTGGALGAMVPAQERVYDLPVALVCSLGAATVWPAALPLVCYTEHLHERNKDAFHKFAMRNFPEHL